MSTQTLIIEAENDKIKALKAFLTAFGINYRIKKNSSKDTTEYLMSNPKNKKRLLESIEQLNNGTTETHSLIEA
ncbi:MAG: hypothetical protein ACOVO2_23400 [Emticicia sp.]|nr:hypothetical protein [Emticicia aquatilis]